MGSGHWELSMFLWSPAGFVLSRLMMSTACCPPRASAFISCASRQVAKGIGSALLLNFF